MMTKLQGGASGIATVLVALGCSFGCGLKVTGAADGDSTASEPRPTKSRSSTPKSSEGDGVLTPEPLEDVPAPTPGPPPDDAVPEEPMAPEEPPTAISPFHPSGALTYQRPIVWTIGAFDPATKIRYTTDGSDPTVAGLSATGKVTLEDLPNGTRIRWVAGESDVVREMVTRVDPKLQAVTHHIVEDVRFDASGGPIVKVAPGATVRGRARAAVWNGTEPCPTCIDQITIGITVGAACIAHVQPNTYPGAAGDPRFAITAPTKPGVYKVRTGFEQQYTCADALGRGLHETEVGTIIVE